MQVNLKYKPLLNHAICCKPDQNQIKIKKVTDICIEEYYKLWRAAILGCVTSLSCNHIRIYRITSFLLFILTLFSFLLILLTKKDDFEKEKYSLQ